MNFQKIIILLNIDNIGNIGNVAGYSEMENNGTLA